MGPPSAPPIMENKNSCCTMDDDKCMRASDHPKEHDDIFEKQKIESLTGNEVASDLREQSVHTNNPCDRCLYDTDIRLTSFSSSFSQKHEFDSVHLFIMHVSRKSSGIEIESINLCVQSDSTDQIKCYNVR